MKLGGFGGVDKGAVVEEEITGVIGQNVLCTCMMYSNNKKSYLISGIWMKIWKKNYYASTDESRNFTEEGPDLENVSLYEKSPSIEEGNIPRKNDSICDEY